MARLMVGMILVLWFVLSVIAAALFRPPLSVTFVLVVGIALLAPGVILIVSGRRRVTLFTKVGGEVVSAARETGRVNIDDIAGRTETEPKQVRMVTAVLVKKGIIPRDVQVS
jgi:hypothetical protein